MIHWQCQCIPWVLFHRLMLCQWRMCSKFSIMMMTQVVKSWLMWVIGGNNLPPQDLWLSSKNCLIVKEAVSLFKGTGVSIYCWRKVTLWCCFGFTRLCRIICSSESFSVVTKTQCFIRYFSYSNTCCICYICPQRWIFWLDVQDLFLPLEEVI